MIALVTGSREYRSRAVLDAALMSVYKRALTAAMTDPQHDGPVLTLIHGRCPSGADKLADDWGQRMREAVTVRRFAADWPNCRPSCDPAHRRVRNGREYCPLAGHYRNQDMVDLVPDVVLAFWRPTAANAGTADCVRRAQRAGLTVVEHDEQGPLAQQTSLFGVGA